MSANGALRDLLPEHEELIRLSAITLEVAQARGYFSARTKAELKELGFSEAQRRVPALVIPIFDVFGDIATYQLRADLPRVNAKGKAVKYETPAGSRMVLDIPTLVRAQIGNPDIPLWITEGIRKADAAVSQGLCCIGLPGVWNWRGRNDVGGLTALADWELIHLKQRDVYLAFDSDLMTNPHVHAALRRLKAFLEARGARVHIVYLDADPSGAKIGLDDFFAAGGMVADLLARAEDDLRPLSCEDSDDSGPYLAMAAGFVLRKDTRDGPVIQPLSNFTARIVEEVIADDGASERVELVIEGDLDEQPLPRIRVPTRRFASLDWVTGEWGARPIIAAGFGNRDRVREAIQRHSSKITRRHVYEHPGWRRLPEHGWSYLHAGGAIGAAGLITHVDVALHGAASHLRLPDPPSGDELRDAVRGCLSLLDLAPDHITVPLFGAVYRAPLCELVPVDTSVFALGPTGVFKTELTSLAMQHFGASFDRLHLPAHWSATDNFLERAAFDFKDAPLVVDDFAPTGSPADIARLHAKADRLLRGAGNRGSRGRMWADGSTRPDIPPRSIIIGTGEVAPRGQSLRSRMMLLDVAPGDVDQERLTAAQAAGRAGTFAAGMAGFLQSLAPQFEELRELLPDLLADFRTKAHAGAAHARTPDAVAHLAVGWWVLLRFAVTVGALTQTEAEQMVMRVWTALGEAAARQSGYQAGEEPAQRFLDLLSSALAAGHIHFASPDGRAPQPSPQAWGWRFERDSAGEYEQHAWRPQGSRAGWIDDDDLCLDLEAALAGVHRVSQASGSGVTVTPKTLAKRLHERGFLHSTEQRRGSLQVRRTLEGRRRSVLHLAQSALTLEESAQSAQFAPDDDRGAQPRDESAGNGLVPWEDLPHGASQSAQNFNPAAA
jgi:hypothetical protein